MALEFHPFPRPEVQEWRVVRVQYHRKGQPLEGFSVRVFSTGLQDDLLRRTEKALQENFGTQDIDVVRMTP